MNGPQFRISTQEYILINENYWFNKFSVVQWNLTEIFGKAKDPRKVTI